MPGNAHCCVPECTNRRSSCKRGLFPNGEGGFVKRRLCGSEGRGGCKNTADCCKNVPFHRLPADKKLLKEWIGKIRRVNIPVTCNSRVCGVHFSQTTSSVPDTFLWTKRCNRRQTRSAQSEGTVDQACQASSAFSSHSAGQVKHDGPLEDSQGSTCTQAADLEGSCANLTDDLAREGVHYAEDESFVVNQTLKATESAYLQLRKQLEAEQRQRKLLETDLEATKRKGAELQEVIERTRMSFTTLCKSPTLTKFYTGLDADAVLFIKEIMGDAVHNACRHTTADTTKFEGHHGGRNRALQPLDEFLLVLMKLRHNFPEEDLAQRFGIHQTTVSRIFSSWIEAIDACISEIDLWPSKAAVQEHMPTVFREAYPSTRVIIDCAEIFIEKPRNPDTQSLTWSSYKHHNTIKFLLAVTPNGVPCFVSDCYGGRISDKHITRLSGLLAAGKFEKGDSIMADRGFEIDDMLAGTGIKLNIPPFLEKREQLEEVEVVETRRIASLRVHVERAIERIKNYHILDCLPTSLCNQGSRLVRICMFLTTLLPPLVPPPMSLSVPGTDDDNCCDI